MHNICWLLKDPKFTEGLTAKLLKREVFSTMRLGSKWADKFNPGDTVTISVTDDPEIQDKCILGKAKVKCVLKGSIRFFRENWYYSSLVRKNIEARFWDDALKAMKAKYGEDKITEDSTISIIELCA